MALFRTLVGRLSLLSLLYCTAFAAPATNHSEVDLVKRAPGDSRNEPIDAHFDTDGWSTIAEQDCYIALCILGGNRVFQRGTKKEAERYYRESGAAYIPFRKDHWEERGVEQITPETTSAEEFPWRSTRRQGQDPHPIYVTPATEAEQSAQGNAVKNGYKNARVDEDKWFKMTFTAPPGSSLGPICKAFHSDPQDFTVCRKSKNANWYGKSVQIAKYIWHLVRSGRTPYRFTPSSSGVRALRSESNEDQEVAPVLSEN